MKIIKTTLSNLLLFCSIFAALAAAAFGVLSYLEKLPRSLRKKPIQRSFSRGEDELRRD